MRDYVRLRRLSQREMFVPLEHPPCDAQADFGEALAVIGGVERKTHYLAVDLPQSDDCFVMVFPAETTEAFLEGHNHCGPPKGRKVQNRQRVKFCSVSHGTTLSR